MSRRLIDRNPDFKRLQDEGYDLAVCCPAAGGGFLLLRDVPYVNSSREVTRGVFVSTFNLAGHQAVMPTHVAMLAGDYPCDEAGQAIEQIRHGTKREEIFPGFFVDHSFSSKFMEGGVHRDYRDYYHKMTTYAAILGGPARRIDPAVTAQTYP